MLLRIHALVKTVMWKSFVEWEKTLIFVCGSAIFSNYPKTVEQERHTPKRPFFIVSHGKNHIDRGVVLMMNPFVKQSFQRHINKG